MPVRSLSSAVFKWPNRETVLAAARAWADRIHREHPCVREVYCVGSYARGDWGVGSDIDVVVIVDDDLMSRAERYATFYPTDVPVHADLWVYSRQEWDALAQLSPHLWHRIRREAVCLARPDHTAIGVRWIIPAPGPLNQKDLAARALRRADQGP